MIRFTHNNMDYMAGSNMTSVTMELSGSSHHLTEVVEQFKLFLIACGYHPENIKEHFYSDDDDVET